MTGARRLLKLARRLWLPIFLAACVTFILFSAEDTLSAATLPSPVNWEFLAIAFGLQVGVWWALATGWKLLLLRRLGTRIELGPALSHLALLSLGKYLPGKVWGVFARGSHLARIGISADLAADATVYEQVLVMHSAAMLTALLGVALFPGWISSLIALLALASILAGPALSNWSLGLLARLISRFSAAPIRIARVEASHDSYALLLAHYFLSWLLHGLVFVAICLLFEQGLDRIGLTTVGLLVFANTFGMAVGFIAVFAPAGIGVREAAIAGILTLGMQPQDAIMLSVTMRLWTVVTDVAIGVGAFIVGRSRE